MRPSGLCFITTPHGLFMLDEDYSDPVSEKLYGCFSGFYENRTVYDSHGKKWQVARIDTQWTRTWWLKLIASTVYNPRVKICLVWDEPKNYETEELKKLYIKAVLKDDDCLTQFAEAKVLTERISEAQSFSGLAEVYRWALEEH